MCLEKRSDDIGSAVRVQWDRYIVNISIKKTFNTFIRKE